MRESDFIFTSVQLLYYKCHKANFQRGGLYIECPDWIKKHEYTGIGDVRSLFNQSFDKDYYKPIKTMGSFDNKNNYIEYESKGDKDKKLPPREYLNTIRPYLSDIISDHKAHERWFHLGNKVIDYKTTLGEWKIQLTMSVNFTSHKDSNETRTMQKVII